MKNEDWDRLQTRLSMPDFENSQLLIALDFDGTLAEIANHPESAALSNETRRLLSALSRRSDTAVSVLSGRALVDVKRMVGLPRITYGGNHGLEIHGPGIRWAHPGAQRMSRSILKDLEQDLKDFPGAFVEHKRLGLAVHYRAVAPRSHRRLKDRIRDRFSGLREHFRFLQGKKTLDLRATVAWDKGHALEAIRRTLVGSWIAVFVGDDATDEEAFRTIGPRALTVRIGRVKDSSAAFVLPHRRLVDSLLARFANRPGRTAIQR